MASFCTCGCEWTITLTIGLVAELKRSIKIDLMSDASAGDLFKLCSDPTLLAECLWLLCKKQAETLQVTREQFDSDLDGDTLDKGWAAIKSAYLETKRPAIRQALSEAIAKQESALERGMTAIATKLCESIDAKFDSIVASALADFDKSLAS
jgi:hypothetical protein